MTLPRMIEYSPELVGLLDDATAALNRLGGAGRFISNVELLASPYMRLEAVHSSRLDGTNATIADLLRFEAGDRSDIDENHDVQQVQNYADALDYGIERLSDGSTVNLELLRDIHERLMAGTGTDTDTAAALPTPEMADALSDLESFLQERSMPFLIQLALAHHQFAVIHPFPEGNGRLARLLIPLVMVERGVLPEPMLHLSVYFERNRGRYSELLTSTSRTGDIDPWLQFFLRGVAEQAADAEARMVGLAELQAAQHDELRADSASTNVVRAAEHLLTTPYVSATSLTTGLGVTFPTAQACIKTLVKRGTLVELTGAKRNRIYYAEAIFHAVYTD
ncbi:MAG: Fic family protein [Ilumatobacter sp.]|jgi:Fic family protein